MTKDYGNWRIILIAALALLLAACGGAEDRKTKHLEKAKAFFNQKNYEKARVEAKNALQILPKDVEARFLLAQIEENLGDMPNAVTNIKRVMEADPSHVEAKIKLAGYYIGSRQPKFLEEAEKLADQVLALHSNDARAFAIKGIVKLYSNDKPQAEELAKKALAANPAEVMANALKTQILVSEKKNDEAIKMLKAALAKDPKADRLRALLVRVYLGVNRFAEATHELEALIRDFPENLVHARHLVDLYLHLKQKDKAKDTILRTIAANPERTQLKAEYIKFIDAHYGKEAAIKQGQEYITQFSAESELKLELAALHNKYREFGKSKEIYLELIQKDADHPVAVRARSSLAFLLIGEGKIAEADEQVSKVLERNSKDSTALLVKGHISLSRGDAQTAVTNYQAVVNSNPSNIEALRYLAAAYYMNNKAELAIQELKKVIKLQPKDLASYAMLARIYLREKNVEEAHKQYEEILKIDEKNMGALSYIFEKNFRAKNYVEALKIVTSIKRHHPKHPSGPYLQGLLYQAQGQHDKAVAQFTESLNVAPNAHEPLAALATSYVLLKQGDKAIAKVTEVIGQQPSNVPALTLLSSLYLNSKEPDKAEQALKDAVSKNPKLAVAYRNLGGFYLAFNKNAEAIKTLKQGIGEAPKDSSLQFMLATAHHQVKQTAEATVIYESLLKQSPKSEVIANNLALILAESEDPEKRKRALQLIELFKTPDNPVLLDTAGWVYYKNGDYDKAVATLEKAVGKQPNLGEIQYHLGMAYFQKKQVVEARKHLELAVESKQDFPGIEEAKSTLAKLSTPK